MAFASSRTSDQRRHESSKRRRGRRSSCTGASSTAKCVSAARWRSCPAPTTTPISQPGRPKPASAPGPRPRANRCRTARRWTGWWRRWPSGSPAAGFRDPTSGVDTSYAPIRSSSGRGRPRASTIGSCTPARSTGGRSSGSRPDAGLLGASVARERVELVQVLEAQLDPDPLAGGSYSHAGPQRLLERFLGAGERRLLIRVLDDLRRVRSPGVVRVALRLAHRPAPGCGLARQGPAGIVPARLEDRAPMPLAELPRGHEVEDLVGEVEETDEIRDRGPAAAKAPRELLLRESQVLDERGARAGLVHRIQVLARHVLDQRGLQTAGLFLVPDDRRHGRE